MSLRYLPPNYYYHYYYGVYILFNYEWFHLVDKFTPCNLDKYLY